MILLEARSEEGVTLVPGRAALSPAGLQIAAFSVLQQSVRVLEVADLKLKQPPGTHHLNRGKGEGQDSAGAIYDKALI